MSKLLKDSAAVDVNDIAGVSKLSVVFDSHPNNVAKKIYANARMQARITVLISWAVAGAECNTVIELKPEHHAALPWSFA